LRPWRQSPFDGERHLIGVDREPPIAVGDSGDAHDDGTSADASVAVDFSVHFWHFVESMDAEALVKETT
jgi:hypothetical protein